MIEGSNYIKAANLDSVGVLNSYLQELKCVKRSNVGMKSIRI